jgi:NAD(P)-dependent dehydrogenase (short-subunit alcohol dehydrogenase family)
MESYGSVCGFAQQCTSLLRIDLAILNAGIMVPTYTRVLETGHELTMQVNYLSTALLALLLVPILESKRATNGTKPPVLTVVSTDSAYGGSLEMDGPVISPMDDAKTYGQFPAYSNSKLLLTMFIGKLAELVKPADVLINITNPGMTDGTSFGRDSNPIAKWLFGIIKYFLARSLDIGASLYLDAALVRGAESHEKFISDWTMKPYLFNHLRLSHDVLTNLVSHSHGIRKRGRDLQTDS